MTQPDLDPMPVFSLLAQDRLALQAMNAYHSACIEHGLIDQAEQVRKAMHEFHGWRQRNPARMKLPDHEHVPARQVAPGRTMTETSEPAGPCAKCGSALLRWPNGRLTTHQRSQWCGGEYGGHVEAVSDAAEGS